MHQQVLHKVIWEERVATAYDRDWTCPLHAQYPLQTKHLHGNATCIGSLYVWVTPKINTKVNLAFPI